jgi:hypothetical protein
MNFSLDNNVNKLVLLLVIGVVLLLLIHMCKKNLGEQVSVLLSVVVLVVCGYFGYVLLNSPDENFMNPNESFSPIYENVEHFQSNGGEQAAANQAAAKQAAANQAAAKQAAANQAAANQAAAEKAQNNKMKKILYGDNADAIVYKGGEGAAKASSNDSVSEMDSRQLFPDDSYSEWCKVVPNNNGDVKCKSLLNAGHHIGVNTTGCSMRNSNRGLRSEPPNPQVQVSPWLQTTICPDPFRKPLDGCN